MFIPQDTEENKRQRKGYEDLDWNGTMSADMNSVWLPTECLPTPRHCRCDHTRHIGNVEFVESHNHGDGYI